MRQRFKLGQVYVSLAAIGSAAAFAYACGSGGDTVGSTASPVGNDAGGDASASDAGAASDAGDGGSLEQQQKNVVDSLAPIGVGPLAVDTRPVASGFTAPLLGTTAPGVSGALFVVDQAGKLWRVDTSTGDKKAYLDVSSLLVPLGIPSMNGYDERGFLGVAFHPKFAQNGLFYTYTSEPASGQADFTYPKTGADCANLGDGGVAGSGGDAGALAPDHQNVLREWHVASPGDPNATPDAMSRVVMRIDWPSFNHNGGMLAFGPDGMLYMSLGDGGGEDDQTCQMNEDMRVSIGHAPDGNGQDTTVAYGKMFRIDPTAQNGSHGWSVPKDNPLASSSSALPEIWAYGLRNFWRFAFDPKTGALIGGDVGENNIEEVDVIRPGGNYGWRVKEATALFDPDGTGLRMGNETESYDTRLAPLVPSGLIDPIAQYGHEHFDQHQGKATIGGYVYRGSAIPELAGKFVFGDYSGAKDMSAAGRLLVLDGLSDQALTGYAKGDLTAWGGLRVTSLVGQPLSIYTLGFAQDDQGELYVMGNTTGVPSGQTGQVLKLVKSSRSSDGGAGAQ